MDAEASQDRRPGGTVQPANQTTTPRQRTPKAETPVVERYELRDPFAEVTYRAKTLSQMELQAERLGALRFHAVAPDGTRTPIEKVNGAWERLEVGETQPTASTRDKQKRTADVASITPMPAEPEGIAAQIDADADRAARIERLELDLRERYVIKRASMSVGVMMIGHTEYRYRGDIARVAFTESTSRLSTDNNNPSVARSMVDVSEARQWQALRVSGHEDFRRMVWLEASVRGINTTGYEPDQADRELLRKEREGRQINRIERVHVDSIGDDGTGATKQSARGSSGRKAVLIALEAVLVAKRVPTRQREAVMAAAAENLGTRLLEGEIHKVKVFDKSAPVQRPVVRPAREVQRTHDRAPLSR
jgi:hypothetical protein